jgi:hypothetical protein
MRSLAGMLLVAALALPAAAEETPADRCAREARRGLGGACETALREDPDNLASLGRLALARFVAGRYMEGLDLYRQWAERAPFDAEAQFQLGAAHATLNMNREALAPLRRAVQLKPDFVAAHRVLAIAATFAGEPAEALAETVAAAELGDVTEMYSAGLMYLDGFGTAPQRTRGLDWVRRAADGGHIGAMRRLGDIYFGGEYGLDPDEAAAQRWHLRAREAERALDAMLAETPG